MEFKAKAKDFEKRKEEATKIIQKYPDRIPVICEKAKGSSIPDIDKTKYLVPKELTAHQFSYIVRKRLKLAKEQSLWLFVNGKQAIKGDTLMTQVYEKMKDPDGFLYIVYSGENVYGIYQ
eukprot:TRINITY_DN2861_c0_g1_i1.p1 TRINITY_DN2861_c0_g1~~TRINITY_DN2861_c0_g1_i1.p1  ORF type:complete len:120 (-),score=23.29 TRINITY_DN2861_c0_g1_i1:101-460(-)